MTFIVAETGVNHDGDIRAAGMLIDAAIDSGADAVKFQAFNAEFLERPELTPLELSWKDFEVLYDCCASAGIEFMCTPFDEGWLEFLQPMLKRIKIASGCIANWPLLEAAAESGLPVILSTGMSTMLDVTRARHVLRDVRDLTLLHCTSAYPAPIADVNLRAMETLNTGMVRVGYSDHTEGIHVALAAVAMGATVIEKHLTLDRSAPGPDHKASIEPWQFKIMVQQIREIEQAMGDGVKKPRPSEDACRAIWRKDD